VPESTQTRPAPRFSIVSAVYDVEPYLADFISSVEAQTFPLDRVEVVMVNDGATDGSPHILAEWQARRPDLVTVVDKPNGGTADARNAGLAVARGEWLTFTDPDDYLAPSYLSEIDAALRRHPGVAMAAARRIVVFDATQEQRPHGTDHLFAEVTRVRNLDEHPDFFSGHAPSTFVRGEVLRRTGLRFSTQVRPNWEDGHFSVSYLLRAERPVVAFVTPAEYFYRKRADASSLLSVSHGDRGRYTTVLEHGYLDALQQAQEKYGRVPDWLQSYILYELSWYFSMEEDPASAGRTVSDETARQMYPLMQRILRLIDPERIESYRDRTFPNVWRDVLLHGYDDAAWHSPYVLVDRLDTDQQLVRVRYRFAGACPHEELYSEGRRVEAAFGRTLLHERILWVPSGAVRVRLDGQDIEVLTEEPKPRRFNLRLWEIRDKYVPRQAVAADRRRPEGPPPPTLEERLTLRLARTRLVGRWFAKAWVLIDQVDNADDSAELLFRWLRRHKRNVNAWFVIEKGTADERRLRRDGYRRIVPYGSLRWKLLMLNAQHLISSQADPPVVRPQQLARMMPRPAWHHTFLNPGLHEDGRTPSLNRLEADLFLTSTPSEYESVAGDGSPYRYSSRETVLTGMPRLDAVLAAG
jgi:glycosyltransferase involved in cell wall biosynthesis